MATTATTEEYAPELVEVLSGFRDGAPFSVVSAGISLKVVPGVVPGAVAVVYTSPSEMDDVGHTAVCLAAGVVIGQVRRPELQLPGLPNGPGPFARVQELDLPTQSLHLAAVLGAIINYHRLVSGRNDYPPVGEVAVATGYPYPMVEAGLAEYERRFG